MSDITQPGIEIHGAPASAGELLPLVYDELRRLAAHKMASEPTTQTLQPTALVHEAWMRLAGSDDRRWQDRRHFFAVAAEAMERILVDRARRKRAAKRGANPQRAEFNDAQLAALTAPDTDDRLLAIHSALEKFALMEPEKAQLVQMRYFAGLTNEQVASLMGISEATAKRWWTYARAWLQNEIASASQ
jgi:RNA polymerase sigma factor (TIGR02999 family)